MNHERVLVTAGAGLIGQAVVSELVHCGRSVVVLDGRAFPNLPRGVRQVAGRITDHEPLAEFAQDVDAVIHLEWSGGVAEAQRDPISAHRRSVDPFLNLLELGRVHRLPIIFASTSTYPGHSDTPWREEAGLARHSVYAVQKAYAEGMLAAHCHTHGIGGVSLRIANAYGPGGRATQIIPRIRSAISTGQPIYLTGDGGQVRDFVHVSDVAVAVRLALEQIDRRQGEPINIGTGRGTSMRELADLMLELARAKVEIIFTPARPEESRTLVLDPSRARDWLGWQPKIDLANGLAQN